MNDYSFGARAALLTSLCLSSLKTHHFSGKQGNWALRQQVLEFQENNRVSSSHVFAMIVYAQE